MKITFCVNKLDRLGGVEGVSVGFCADPVGTDCGFFASCARQRGTSKPTKKRVEKSARTVNLLRILIVKSVCL
jgi:hypothetical protein